MNRIRFYLPTFVDAEPPPPFEFTTLEELLQHERFLHDKENANHYSYAKHGGTLFSVYQDGTYFVEGYTRFALKEIRSLDEVLSEWARTPEGQRIWATQQTAIAAKVTQLREHDVARVHHLSFEYGFLETENPNERRIEFNIKTHYPPPYQMLGLSVKVYDFLRYGNDTVKELMAELQYLFSQAGLPFNGGSIKESQE